MRRYEKKIAKVCAYCSRTFTAEPNRLRTGRGKYCTKYCADSAREIDPITYFWEHISKSTDPDGCWEWTGTLDDRGYAIIHVNHKPMHASRFSYELNIGPIPKGLFCCHKCDTPACVRVSHIFLGTSKENMLDAKNKGRLHTGDDHWSHKHPEKISHNHSRPSVYGETHPMAKLTDEQVLEIRRLHDEEQVLDTDIAQQFCVTKTNIGYIVKRKTWRHLL